MRAESQADTARSKLLSQGRGPKLIDKWWKTTELQDTIRFEVDKRDEFGQFILT